MCDLYNIQCVSDNYSKTASTALPTGVVGGRCEGAAREALPCGTVTSDEASGHRKRSSMVGTLPKTVTLNAAYRRREAGRGRGRVRVANAGFWRNVPVTTAQQRGRGGRETLDSRTARLQLKFGFDCGSHFQG